MFALMPVPGDVDLVVAAELMEAGHTVVRGFVTPGRTVVVASSHRVYGITEKSAMGDGIADSNAVLSALRSRSRRLICFDMETLADSHKSVISSVLFGRSLLAARCRSRKRATKLPSPHLESRSRATWRVLRRGSSRPQKVRRRQRWRRHPRVRPRRSDVRSMHVSGSSFRPTCTGFCSTACDASRLPG